MCLCMHIAFVCLRILVIFSQPDHSKTNRLMVRSGFKRENKYILVIYYIKIYLLIDMSSADWCYNDLPCQFVFSF